MDYRELTVSALERALSFAVKNPAAAAKELVGKYETVARIFSAEHRALAQIESLSEGGATFVKLLGEIISRRETDKYKFGAKHSPKETDEYFCALLLTRPVEVIYAMSFDKSGRAIGADLVGEGVINASGFLPRRLVEIAINRRAAYITLAHNHPQGRAKTSTEDRDACLRADSVLSSVGVKLARSIVVCGNELESIVVNENL